MVFSKQSVLKHLNFITIHYAWIIFCGLLGLIVLAPEGNVAAVDAYFFGASASTESGLNTVDVKELRTYQQIFLYVIPIITNLGVINIIVVVVRILWFKRRFRAVSSTLVRPEPKGVVFSLRRRGEDDVEAHPRPLCAPTDSVAADIEAHSDLTSRTETSTGTGKIANTAETSEKTSNTDRALYIPSPRDRDDGKSFIEKEIAAGNDFSGQNKDDEDDQIKPVPHANNNRRLSMLTYRSRAGNNDDMRLSAAKSIENAAGSMFILGARANDNGRRSDVSQLPRPNDLPGLSKQVTIGRNSQFYDLSEEDEEKLGGIEYAALKLLLKIVIGYYVGLHLLGIIGLIPWIHTAPSKYREYLIECGNDFSWWAIYSTQTMINNLGFTLTPDSMISFRDATWPMLLMTFLAFAGNTLYPVVLRLVIWIVYRATPTHSPNKMTLKFLLDHPRRCYTLLFPSRPTWILFGLIAALNIVDVILIIVLDLYNPTITDLPMGPRILAALFQAASSRHTGTATMNLAEINPAVQFSLLVMMYIAILPIAISIRTSNTYEEQALGIYSQEHQALDESRASSYFMMHMRNQLSFDLWYIFLGTFCLCVAESERIADNNEPAFSVFSVFFEVVSAYGNVGLSLGHPTVSTSLCGLFGIFGKVVICAMMIRGRHRCLPYTLDRAIMLPGEAAPGGGDYEDSGATRSRLRPSMTLSRASSRQVAVFGEGADAGKTKAS
ncbi:cation transport protein-domain-containing protein [Microdochium trichocladiopsis]|uniref:Potassium transport protein n=1 Tax=Microdochium trichocladiopsis TaxID=1682393 RepID=A0A9P8XW28_9PEZI|nr:cation transport protein-domain-containing protein [Microdochium trichocladiopsis]KAH7016190.1 cation transport protein-domain-containing protein [Microdochium trichocladiopsis]